MGSDPQARGSAAGLRIFLGLTEIAGYYTSLERALRELGADATLVDLSDHPFRYGSSPTNRLARWTMRASRRRAVAHSRAAKNGWKVVEGALRVALLLWAAARFDVFVFGFSTTFLGRPAFELPLLRLLGKRIIGVFHGSDSRPPYLDGSLMAADRGRTVQDCIALAAKTKRRVAVIDRYADWVIDHPLTAHFHERPCVEWLALGIPGAQNGSRRTEPFRRVASTSRSVRILHSPSHPEAKGTVRIRRAIEVLRSKGHAIDFVEIVGRPNAEVLDALTSCDFVVDQLYSDTPMAGFAAEAARFGKPAVVGGYGGEELHRSVPEWAVPPSLYCDPEEIEDAIERLVVDERYRSELGARAREFVQEQWAPRVVAERYLRLISGDVPAEWIFDPSRIRYVGGCCFPAERLHALVREVVALGGREALQLADKPELETLLVEFANPQHEAVLVACSSGS